jgi:hypothetical protein
LIFSFNLIKSDTTEKPCIVKYLDSGDGGEGIKNNFFPVDWWHGGEGRMQQAMGNMQ